MNYCKYDKKCPLKNNIKTDSVICYRRFHADYEKTIHLFKHFKLIDNNYKWKVKIVSCTVRRSNWIGRGNYEDFR